MVHLIKIQHNSTGKAAYEAYGRFPEMLFSDIILAQQPPFNMHEMFMMSAPTEMIQNVLNQELKFCLCSCSLKFQRFADKKKQAFYSIIESVGSQTGPQGPPEGSVFLQYPPTHRDKKNWGALRVFLKTTDQKTLDLS